jgi:methionine-rich copper-binding protein CopC
MDAIVRGVIAALAVVALTVHAAAAHAVPERGNPPIDGVVSAAPEVLEVVFSEEIVPDGTALEVYSLEGERVDAGDSAADLDDPERRRVTVGLNEGLGPGAYLVQWTSHSAIDDDVVSGSFQFRIDPDATPEPAAATPVAAPAVTEEENDEGEGSSWVTVALIGLAAVLGIGALAALVMRQRSRERVGPADG